MSCRDEHQFGWCPWCCRFIEDGDIDDERCRIARERLAAKIEAEMRVPQPSQTFGILFAIVIGLLVACAAVL